MPRSLPRRARSSSTLNRIKFATHSIAAKNESETEVSLFTIFDPLDQSAQYENDWISVSSVLGPSTNPVRLPGLIAMWTGITFPSPEKLRPFTDSTKVPFVSYT